jgi:hypothetical protein
MRLDINQKKISIRNKFNIFLNGHPAYQAQQELFRLLPVINLFEQENPVVIRFSARKRLTLLNINYDITRWDNAVFHFRTVSFFKRHYRCEVDGDVYDIYGHRGLKYSVYRNDVQVAYWQKESVSWFEGDNYKLIASDDVSAELLALFNIIIDNAKSRKNKGTFNINWGYIGPQARPFDPSWIPKEKGERGIL